MLTPLEALSADAEPMPEWLGNHQAGDPFPREAFFASRIVYYPGSATDGHPLRIFGKAHAAHCFVYADYMLSETDVREQLTNENSHEHPRGYRLLAASHVTESDLTPNGWTPHVGLPSTEDMPFTPTTPPGGPFALWAVLERLDSFDETHGPKRIAILHVGGDGYYTFDALFCQRGCSLPYGVLLQDHGYGGNYDRNGFGGPDSRLWKLATNKGDKLPKWLLVATDNTHPWPRYVLASDPDNGGMHCVPRSLFVHDTGKSSLNPDPFRRHLPGTMPKTRPKTTRWPLPT